jgi:Zn-finger nucleic acid-binding protein
MCLCRVRGVEVDLCGFCGAAWLDGGELGRLSEGRLEEVGAPTLAPAAAAPAASGLEVMDKARSAAPRLREVVLCTSCDEELDLTKTNWMINMAPWCRKCASSHTGWFSIVAPVLAVGVGLVVLSFNIVVVGLFLVTVARSGLRLAMRGGAGLVDIASGMNNVKAVRIRPKDAAHFFEPFRRVTSAAPKGAALQAWLKEQEARKASAPSPTPSR